MTIDTDTTRADGAGADTVDADTTDLDRSLEAILIVADEPQSLMHLATAAARPGSRRAA